MSPTAEEASQETNPQQPSTLIEELNRALEEEEEMKHLKSMTEH
jgi:serine phosphatase RsbU (regulator of sigma subunit)